MKKEILILGIICLFVGVGIQPAFAINISNVRLSENIEDCNCQVVDNYDIVRIKSLLNRGERLLNRLAVFTKLIPILNKDNPKVIEDCEELSKKVRPLKEMNEEFNSDSAFLDDELICDILKNMAIGSAYVMENIMILTKESLILRILLYPIAVICGIIMWSSVFLMLFVFPQCL